METLSVPKANEEAIRWYVDLARYLKESHGIKGDLTVADILNFKDILVYEEKSVPEEMFFSCFETLLSKLNVEREREGELIKQDLMERLEQIRADGERIEKAWPEAIRNHEEMLRQKILEVSGTVLDEAKVLQEMGFYMERLDIAEEIARLKGHVAAFYRYGPFRRRDRPQARLHYPGNGEGNEYHSEQVQRSLYQREGNSDKGRNRKDEGAGSECRINRGICSSSPDRRARGRAASSKCS